MDGIALVLSLLFWVFGCWFVPFLVRRAREQGLQQGRDEGIQEGYDKCLQAQQARQQSQQ